MVVVHCWSFSPTEDMIMEICYLSRWSSEQGLVQLQCFGLFEATFWWKVAEGRDEYPTGNDQISHLWKRRIIFPRTLGRDMFFSRRVIQLTLLRPFLNHCFDTECMDKSVY